MIEFNLRAHDTPMKPFGPAIMISGLAGVALLGWGVFANGSGSWLAIIMGSVFVVGTVRAIIEARRHALIFKQD